MNQSEMITEHIIHHPITLAITDSWTDIPSLILGSIETLFRKMPKIRRIIIISSKRSIEIEWIGSLQNTAPGLPYAAAMGKRKDKISAFHSGRHILFTNDESLGWTKDIKTQSSDLIIIDELSRYRHHISERYHFLRRLIEHAGCVAAFSRIPIPHESSEIWDEIFLLDGGVHLGDTKSAFIERYFFISRIMTDGHIKVYYEPKPGFQEAINIAIQDICLNLYSSHVMSPIVRNVYVSLSGSELSRYGLFAKDMYMRHDNGHITASDSSRLAGKLLQMASGTVYDDNKEVIFFHNHKIELLRLLFDELHSQNILVAYWFRHEAEHIIAEIPEARIISSPGDINDWNESRIHIGLVNSSMGGRPGDLSRGGHIMIWFSPTWSLKLYSMTNERIASEAIQPVIIHMIARNTIDEKVYDILKSRKNGNNMMLEAIRSSST